MRTERRMQHRGKSDKRTLILASITAFMAIVALISIFFVIRSFIEVKDFELSGVTQYEKSMLASASGIKLGDKIYSLDLEKAEQNILAEFPYIQTVTIERRLSGKIIFRVEERRAVWYMQDTAGDFYAIDSGLLVIEETPKNDKFVLGGATELVLSDLGALLCGSVLEFGKDEVEYEVIRRFIGEVQNDPIKSRITKLDIKNRFEIWITVDGTYEVYFGDTTNVSEKLDAVKYILDAGNRPTDVSNAEKPIAKPKYE